jgi:hypothetical protein
MTPANNRTGLRPGQVIDLAEPRHQAGLTEVSGDTG